MRSPHYNRYSNANANALLYPRQLSPAELLSFPPSSSSSPSLRSLSSMEPDSVSTVRAFRTPSSSPSSSPSPSQSLSSSPLSRTTMTNLSSSHKMPTTPTTTTTPPQKITTSVKPGNAHASGFSSVTSDALPSSSANAGGVGDGSKAKTQSPGLSNDGGGGAGTSTRSLAPTTTGGSGAGRNDASGSSSSSGVTGTNLGISLTPSGTTSATTTTAATPFFSANKSPTNGNTPANAENDPGADNASSGSALGSGGNGNGGLGGAGGLGNGRSSGFGDGNGGFGFGSGNGNGGLGSGNMNGGPISGNEGLSFGGSSLRSGTSSGTSTPGMTSPAVVDNGDTISTGGVQEHGLSGGAIAGTVIAALVGVIAVVVFLLRRRSRKRRGERRKRWWTSHDKVDGGIGSGGGIPDEHRRSARSSFETTVDHSLTPRLGEDFEFPSFPPMAELRGTPLLARLDTSVGSGSPRIIPENRFSGSTVSSTGSDGQWFVIGDDPLAPEVSSPMSVRPFSPTESFAFPKPPTNEKKSNVNSSRSSSGHVLSVRNPSVAEEKVPALPVRAANPFNDPDPFIIYSTAAAAAVTPRLGGGGDAPVREAAVVNSLTTDPFADPEPCPTSNNNSRVGSFNDEFMEIERIKRSFDPSLDDELGVVPGDKVRIIEVFSDGWAMVEKNPSCGLVDVKGKGRESEQGLIPVECLRLPGMVSERVSG